MLKTLRRLVYEDLSKNFFNTIIYKFDESAVTEEFLGGVISISATSLSRVPVGTRALVINSKGLRTSSNGPNLANQAANRRLDRYQYGAEFIENIEVMFHPTFNVEIGDLVLLDGTDLKISNTMDGTRELGERLFEVQNKTLDIKTGMVKLTLVDTSYSLVARRGLIGPSSLVASGASQTGFTITQSYNSAFGANEYMKWTKLMPGVFVRVRSNDFTTRNSTAEIDSISGNVITLKTALGFTPQAGDQMTLAHYDSMTDAIKRIYVFMSDGASDFNDGEGPYLLL